MNKQDAVIVAYGRTPLARAFKGSFADMHPIEYGAQALKGTLAKIPNLNPDLIDDVIIGCATPEKYVGYNVARLLAQRAGLPDQVSAQTINRFCSSGLQSVAIAANAIKAGEADVIVAGGIEIMTGIDMAFPDQYKNEYLDKNIPGTYMGMGITGENVAEKYSISRIEMEEYAVASHQKAAAAKEQGKFVQEIVPITLTNGDTLKDDEGIRPSTNMESLAKLKPCFIADGKLTAATSSQMTDGAAFAVIMSYQKAQELSIEPIAKFVSFAVAGVPADIMGIGPVAAVPKLMKKTGLSINDMDTIELNEAFASQVIATIKELGLDSAKVNPNGGAIALGHPLGATGTVLLCKAIEELKRIKGRYGLITMCVGGGMGAAGIVELLKGDA
ncbi:MAG: thiolase family protein [Defluviitaleaceae bacterium]|nr:thiolase family protein [Defluviitaleaceae bacterium]